MAPLVLDQQKERKGDNEEAADDEDDDNKTAVDCIVMNLHADYSWIILLHPKFSYN